jgi:nitrite reductase/ring-hydroxylating ferredoxin subunit
VADDEEEEWWDVAGIEDVPEHQPLAVQAHGYPIALFRVGDDVFALWSRCPHAGGPLDDGYQKGDVVVCPWHGSMFRVSTGERLDGPSAVDATSFPVEVEDGRVWVGPPPPGIDPPPPSFLQF